MYSGKAERRLWRTGCHVKISPLVQLSLDIMYYVYNWSKSQDFLGVGSTHKYTTVHLKEARLQLCAYKYKIKNTLHKMFNVSFFLKNNINHIFTLYKNIESIEIFQHVCNSLLVRIWHFMQKYI